MLWTGTLQGCWVRVASLARCWICWQTGIQTLNCLPFLLFMVTMWVKFERILLQVRHNVPPHDSLHLLPLLHVPLSGKVKSFFPNIKRSTLTNKCSVIWFSSSQLSMTIDIACHWLHLHTSLLQVISEIWKLNLVKLNFLLTCLSLGCNQSQVCRSHWQLLDAPLLYR